MSEHQEAILLLRIASGLQVGETARVPGDRPLLVGRAPESDLLIASDGELSALHFSVEQADGGYLLRDLGSRNGTRVNRERVREAMLRDGDEIRAGATTFVVAQRAVGASARAPAPTAPSPPTRPARPARRTPSGAPFTEAARRLLREERSPLYAVLDAARDPRIRLLLGEAGEQIASLYAGFQGEILGDVGPTLVHLPHGSPLLDTLVDNGWGESWGVFLTSGHPFIEVRKHLRRFLLIESGAGKQMYFRFYDPRVLRGFLPSCRPRQIEALFEEIESFTMEAEEPRKLLRFTAQAGKVVREESALARVD
jgi:hypothetical protein